MISSSFSGAAEVLYAIYCLWSSYFLSLKYCVSNKLLDPHQQVQCLLSTLLHHVS